MLNFVEDETVQLMLLGLCGSEAVDCVVHGVEKNSKLPPSQLNPLDAVFRMAAHMAACFTRRVRLSACLLLQHLHIPI